MRSLSNVGLGLSLVFGFLLLALVAELYYLLWWKKRFTDNTEIEEEIISPTSELLYMFCCKNHSSLTSTTAINPPNLSPSLRITNTHDEEEAEVHHPNKDIWLLKSYADQDGVEAELMRQYNLSGPPKSLFPIQEETTEDLESEEDGSRSSSSRSFNSDVIVTVETTTPFFTPVSSPAYFNPVSN